MEDSTARDALGPTVELDEASSRIKTEIQNKNVEAVKEYLDQFDNERRRQIVNFVHDEQTPFFKACIVGDVAIVDYMLSECSVDPEVRGLYILVTENFNDRVTPLWVAVSEQHIRIVERLVEHGVDINSSTSTNSTPVRCACYCANLTIAKYLVEHGANIHQSNVFGGTCLMNATRGSVELCEFLVNNGASINATTNIGHTAVYYAITGDRLDLVKFFLNNNASHWVKIRTWVHILNITATYGNRTIFEYIQENIVVKPSLVADAYELLGAKLVDDSDDKIDEALLLWRQAMDLRYANPDAPLIKNIPENTNYVYQFCREPMTPQECAALDQSNTDRIFMNALLVRERILGTDHDRTVGAIRYRGAVYADTNHFQRGVDLWKYAYRLQRQHLPASDEDVVNDVSMVVELIKEMINKHASGDITEKVRAEDIVQLLTMLVDQLQEFSQELSIRPLTKRNFSDFKWLMVIILHSIHAFFLSEGQDIQQELFKAEVKRAVSLGAASEEGESLLHLALNTDSSRMDGTFIFEFPSNEVVRSIVNAGGSVSVVDEKKNSPLHQCVTSWKEKSYNPGRGDQGESLAWLLIEHGAHVDARNSDKETPLEFLHQLNLVFPVNYTSLKCLAARTLADSSIDYRAYLPPLLHHFVDMHA